MTKRQRTGLAWMIFSVFYAVILIYRHGDPAENLIWPWILTFIMLLLGGYFLIKD